MLPHLTNGWQVDQAIQHEEDKVRFGQSEAVLAIFRFMTSYDVKIHL